MSDTSAMLLTPAEMAEVDRRAIAGGIAGIDLMENAGRAVALEILRRWSPAPVSVLCGPGNNGGDGFVVARLLKQAGWPVRLGLLGDAGRLAGDAAHQAGRWDGPIEPAAPGQVDAADLVVDALFGAGLSRPLEGPARSLVERMALGDRPVIAIDVPSGIDGGTGEVRGAAARATLTVTFFRRKPGHLLLPGRQFCGETVLADIGIPADVLTGLGIATFANGPSAWDAFWPRLSIDGHKYRRGHALLPGGRVMTGAARLAARAALRAGAGLVTLAAPEATFAVYAGALSDAIVHPIAGPADFAALLVDRRRNAVLVGPGGGVTADTRAHALAALGSGRPTILDADALSVFARRPADLFEAIRGPCLLTPHEGEFARLFPVGTNRLASARAAAMLSKATVLLKGADTVIAAPDGRAFITENAPPDLATAGSGDVLAGIALGLLAQGMPLPQAAAAAAFLHGDAGRRAGPGLVASDLVDALPEVIEGQRLARS